MSEKYEREIEELMHRLEGRMRREPLSRRMSRRFRPYSSGFRSAFAGFLRRPPTEQFMMAGMGLVLVSLVLSVLSLQMWAGWVSILSVVFFVAGLALALTHRQSPGYQQRWRGQEINYRANGPNLWTSLRTWLRRRRRL